MSNSAIIHPLFSFADTIRAVKPREAIEAKLIGLLTARLGPLKIIWSPKAFRGGLNNPQLPKPILKKLETILWLAETLEWHLSKSLVDELDATVEDIESFNPPFIEWMRRAAKDFQAGRFVMQEQMEVPHRVTH